MELPQHTSLTKDTFCYSTKGAGDFWDYKERKWLHCRKVYSYINRFWEKHIGENYNKCHKKLISNLKEKFGYDKESFYAIHTELNPISNKPRYRWDEFVVNENGNIYWNKRSWKRSRLTYKFDNRVIHGYMFDKSDFTQEEIDIIIKRVGKDKLNRIFNEMITPEEYKKLKELLDNWWFEHSRVEIERKARPVVEGEIVEIKRGTSKHKQYRHESIKAYKKEERKRKREKLEKEERLLHNIEEDRKRKERDENSLKILKHGFDEEISFRGEEYHGKKKKRK
jgi:hypothetical protein